MTRLLAALMIALAWLGTAEAVEPDEILNDPALEARARTISRELRCLVCQNQSIDDSDAPLARDLRVLVRDRLSAGDSDTQVMDYVVSRYGDFVLLKPPFKATTLLLWGGPVLFLLFGLTALVLFYRRRSSIVPPLSLEDERRAAALLDAPEDRT